MVYEFSVSGMVGLGLEPQGLVGSGKVAFGLGWYGWAGHGRVW